MYQEDQLNIVFDDITVNTTPLQKYIILFFIIFSVEYKMKIPQINNVK